MAQYSTEKHIVEEVEDGVPRAKQPEQIDINHNISSAIANPLAHLSREQLSNDVADFVAQSGLDEHLELFQKGALAAQTPDFESIQELDDDDKNVLRQETSHKWSQPRALYMTIIVCSIGAAVQGWDQTGANGANLSFPQQFGIDPEPGTPNYERNNWLLGLVNGSPHLGASFCGCWLSDPINYYFGRRGLIFFAAIFCTFSVLGSAFTQNWQQLLVTRILLGIGWGAKASTIPVYAAENSPAYIRGGLVMSWQLWTAFGIMCGFAANLIFYRVGLIAWRLQLGSAMLPAIPLALLVYLCPESPRWYLKKNRPKDAFASLCRLRVARFQAARDLYYMHSLLQIEDALVGKRTNYVKRFVELFTIPRNRRAAVAAFTVMMSQQMCGINIISYYSSTIFQDAGATVLEALFTSFGFGALNFAFAFPAVYLIDAFGRRSLLLSTFPCMIVTLLAAGMCFFIPATGNAHLGPIATFIFIFTAFYSVGTGPVPFAYSAEVFPLTHREVGMSFAVASINFWGFLLSLTFFRIVAAFTIEGAFGFYAGLNVLCFVMILLFVPETKLRTLEELDYIFGVPTGLFVRHVFRNSIPYCLKRYILCDKSAVSRPLYHDATGGSRDAKE